MPQAALRQPEPDDNAAVTATYRMEEDALSLEAGLSLLINLTGKLRMLSHRAVMFALLVEKVRNEDGKGERAFDGLNKVCSEFEMIVTTLRQGNKELGVGAETIEFLNGIEAISPQCSKALTRFLRELTVFRRENIEQRRDIEPAVFYEFADFVENHLLEELNALIERIKKGLDRLSDERAERERASRRVVESAASKLSKVVLKVRLVSINATIEANRAGSAGRAFASVATEITNLSNEVSGLVSELRQNLKEM
jgi:methyl-accepting chemotaxis protein